MMINKKSSNVQNAYKKCNLISYTSKWWWLYCCCYLCLLNGINIHVVNGAYSETDDLINELDRPSEY